MKDIIRVLGMSCSHCEGAVEGAVKAFAGVKEVKASASLNQVEIEHEGADLDKIRQAINDLEFECE